MAFNPRVTQGFQTNYAQGLSSFGMGIAAGIEQARRKKEDKESADAQSEILAPILGYDPEELAPQLRKMKPAERNTFFQMSMQKAQQEEQIRQFEDNLFLQRQKLRDEKNKERMDNYYKSLNFFQDVKEFESLDEDRRIDNQRQAEDLRLRKQEAAKGQGPDRVIRDLHNSIDAAEKAGNKKLAASLRGALNKQENWASSSEEIRDPQTGEIIYSRTSGPGANTARTEGNLQEQLFKIETTIPLLRELDGKLTPTNAGMLAVALHNIFDKSVLADMGMGNAGRMKVQNALKLTRDNTVKALTNESGRSMSDKDAKRLLSLLPGAEFHSSAKTAEIGRKQLLETLLRRKAIINLWQLGIRDASNLTLEELDEIPLAPEDKFWLAKHSGI